MSRRVLVVATNNPHKLVEIQAVLADLDVELRSCADYPSCPEVVEDGDTLEANAAKKAREIRAFTGEWTLADDTGLEVDALDGAPGAYSARWSGPGCTYDDNNAKLLRELDEVPEAQRTARFRCVMALAIPAARRDDAAEAAGADEFLRLFEGRIEGRIATRRHGAGGFGYDPLFLVPEEGCTLAELSPAHKNRISHRARALRALRSVLALELQRAPS